MPTFDGKSEKVVLFEDIFKTSFKIHNQLRDEDIINCFNTLMRGDALKTFKNIGSPTPENLGEILTVFRREKVKPQRMSTTKLNFQRLVCNLANQKLTDFLHELLKLLKHAFGIAPQGIIEHLIYAKTPLQLKKLINQAPLEKSSYEQIVTHLGIELELDSWEALDELQMNTVTQRATEPNPEKPKLTCHHRKKSGPWRNQCRQLKRRNNKLREPRIVLQILTMVQKTLTRTTITKTTKEMTQNRELLTHPMGHVQKTNHSTEKR